MQVEETEELWLFSWAPHSILYEQEFFGKRVDIYSYFVISYIFLNNRGKGRSGGVVVRAFAPQAEDWVFESQ